MTQQFFVNEEAYDDSVEDSKVCPNCGRTYLLRDGHCCLDHMSKVQIIEEACALLEAYNKLKKEHENAH